MFVQKTKGLQETVDLLFFHTVGIYYYYLCVYIYALYAGSVLNTE